MKLIHIINIFLFISSTYGYPTKPLDERSTELTWQAWLLVQNNGSDNISRKKVVPKSVFIAPDFSKPCPKGYEPDNKGGCIELHTFNNEEQLNFLFNKLAFLSGLSNGNENIENQPTQGPVHLNIPIGSTEADDKLNLALVFTKDGQTNDDEIAVVVAPTNGSFDPAKLNINRDEHNPEIEETTTQATTTETMAPTTFTPITGTVTQQPSTQPTTTSFTTVLTTHTTDNPTTITTTTDTTTEIGTTTEVETTFSTTLNLGDEVTDLPETTAEVFDRPAIFFKIPTEEDITNSESETTTTRPELENDAYSTNYVSSEVVFKDQTPEENVRHSSNFISFPDDDFVQRQSFKRPQREDADYALQAQSFYSHRNRDKNIWKFNRPWREAYPRRTLVLIPKFNNDDSSQLYRELSYIFNKRTER